MHWLHEDESKPKIKRKIKKNSKDFYYIKSIREFLSLLILMQKIIKIQRKKKFNNLNII